jgi:hypothetical protein
MSVALITTGMLTHRSHRPRTPLLLVLLGAAVLVAAVTFVAGHVQISMNILETLVATALIAALGGRQILAR